MIRAVNFPKESHFLIDASQQNGKNVFSEFSILHDIVIGVF